MFKDGTTGIGAELIRILRDFILVIEEIVFQKRKQRIGIRKCDPDWDRAAQMKLYKEIKLGMLGTVCTKCGCLSCDRTSRAIASCISLEGGATK
jgi:hypothetical protein